MVKKTEDELISDARKAVADFNRAPRGAFLLAMNKVVAQNLAGVRGKFRAFFVDNHRTIQ
jgi:hypothetical protein